ncbi:MAG: hypothetical protein M3512_04585 [Bacteroidota bacterium]|nr:hypothetical protein [Bacteroidota bacterium]
MIKDFTAIYLLQLIRLLKEIGLWRSIIIIIASVAAFSAFINSALLNPTMAALAQFILVFALHVQRKDRDFLKIVNINDWLLNFTHYHLLSFHAYIVLAFFFHFIPLIILFTIISFIPFLDFKIKSFNPILFDFSKYIPNGNYELKSGTRKHKFFFLTFYVLAIILYSYPMVAFCVIVLFTFMVTSFYNEAEPWTMLESFKLPPKKFLWFKVKSHLTIFWVLCLPLVMIFLIMQFQYWYVMLALIFVSSVIQALSICLKYTFYEPGKHFDNSIFIGLYVLSIFVIFFIPVPMIMLIHYARKATVNLNRYLYDYN